jgi:hypothetical protein
MLRKEGNMDEVTAMLNSLLESNVVQTKNGLNYITNSSVGNLTYNQYDTAGGMQRDYDNVQKRLALRKQLEQCEEDGKLQPGDESESNEKIREILSKF